LGEKSFSCDGRALEGLDPEKVTDEVSGCFDLGVGDHVEANGAPGTIVEAQCSPTNDFTQYWVQPTDGDRLWATANELTIR